MEHTGIGCKCRRVRRWLATQETQVSIETIPRKKRACTLLPSLALGLVFFAEQETFQEIFSRASWHRFVISALMRLRQQDLEFQDSLGYVVGFKEWSWSSRSMYGGGRCPAQRLRLFRRAGRIWTFRSIFNFPGTRGWGWGGKSCFLGDPRASALVLRGVSGPVL